MGADAGLLGVLGDDCVACGVEGVEAGLVTLGEEEKGRGT